MPTGGGERYVQLRLQSHFWRTAESLQRDTRFLPKDAPECSILNQIFQAADGTRRPERIRT